MSKSSNVPQEATRKQSACSASWIRRAWHGWMRPVVIAVVVVTSMKSAVADWNDVPSGSMNPTIVTGDRVFVNKLAYGLRLPYTRIELVKWDGPARGDIVTFWSPESEIRMIKRVVAVPGDTVAVRDGRLHVNGDPADYDADPRGTASRFRRFEESLEDRRWTVQLAPVPPAFSVDVRNVEPVTLGRDEFYLLGDNRDNSRDSRFFGPVTRDRLIGRANYVVLSLDYDHAYRPRMNRWLMPLD